MNTRAPSTLPPFPTAIPCILFAVLGAAAAAPAGRGADAAPEPAWRPLPLVTAGKIDPAWVHVGYGGFVVEDGLLRTDCDPRGLGLLVYKKEHLGNCQIRVVFKAREAKSNSGVYVRLDDGILSRVGHPGPAFDRDASGTPSKESMEKVKAAAELEEGAWFAVHRGYEVQISDTGDPMHRTAAIYSLAPSSAAPATPGQWRTLIITLTGNWILVELDGKFITRFDSESPGLPPRKQWHEPKREPRRPVEGLLGLQNHDPGDDVWFKEVSVRALPMQLRWGRASTPGAAPLSRREFAAIEH